MPVLRYFVIYKPFRVLCQFSPQDGKQTLRDIIDVPKDIYPVGRLDYDSEGLLILTNDKTINHRLLDPAFLHHRKYWAQVDGAVSDAAIQQLCAGVTIQVNGKRYRTRKCAVRLLDEEEVHVPERRPPIRYRKNIPAPWIQLTLSEGKNRQVRKMCASVNAPVLRLIRAGVEDLSFEGMSPGQIEEFSRNDLVRLLHL